MPMTPADFSVAFLIVAVVGLVGVADLFGLARDAGAVVSGHRPDKTSASERSSVRAARLSQSSQPSAIAAFTSTPVVAASAAIIVQNAERREASAESRAICAASFAAATDANIARRCSSWRPSSF